MYEQQILNLIKKESPLNPLAYVHNIVKPLAADNLKQIMLFDKESGQDDFTTAFHGDINADIFVINDKPRSDSLYSMQDSEEYNLLKKACDALGYDSERLFLIDAVNFYTYRLVGDDKIERIPSKEEVDACKIYVDHAIDIVRPKVVLCLGSISSNLYHKAPLLQIRGQWIEAKGIPAIATHHPERLLNKQSHLSEDEVLDLKEDFVNDLEKVIDYVNKIKGGQ